MSDSGLIDFQRKFNLSDDFMEIVKSLFDKLIDFGYISKSQKHHLIYALNGNVSEIFLGNKSPFDYKSGYYDADKKILYIKDEKDIKSVYLRILYAISTIEISPSSHIVGFGLTKLGKTNYKLYHENFALNRAVFSNITCKLLGTLPTNIKIMPTYKTYSHDFLGHNISSNNDIYALEGKILSEMCYALDVDENLIYSYIFSNSPIKSLEKMFGKCNFTDSKKFLQHFDSISRKYSNYCKLNYYSKLLNLNYIEMKKKVLDDCLDDLKKQREQILLSLRDELIKLKHIDYADSFEQYPDLSLSLSEAIENLESDILKELTTLQNILSNKIVSSIAYLSPYKYACKLKQFNNLLIVPNQTVSDAIYNTILYKLMPDGELTAINKIQKIRYSLINNVLFSDKYIDVSKKIGFYSLPLGINDDDTSAITIVTANDSFAYLAEINGLNKRAKKLDDNCEVLKVENLKYLLNSDFSNMYVDKIEKIVSSLKNSFPEFKNASLDSMYCYSMKDFDLLITNIERKTKAFITKSSAGKYSIQELEISNYFPLFYGISKSIKPDSLLPTMYKERRILKIKL